VEAFFNQIQMTKVLLDLDAKQLDRAQRAHKIREGISWLQARPQLLENSVGLLRVSALPSAMDQVEKRIENQQPIPDHTDAHIVVCVVKKATKECYSSLMAFTKDEFDEYAQLKGEDQKIEWLKNKIEEKLRGAYGEEKEAFKEFIMLLNTISQHSKKNMMDASNLGVVVSPIFSDKLSQDIINSRAIHDKQGAMGEILAISKNMTEMMIAHAPSVFP
jgi:hypothetical protein